MNRSTVAALVLFFASPTIFAQEQSVVLRQTGSPLSITQYKASFQPEESGGRYSRGNPDQIRHFVAFTNSSTKEVVAVQIGLAAFDAFNGFMDRFSGWSIERVPAGANKTGEWTQRPYAAFAFQGYGTGVAYVNAVRFADGTIWRANLAEVLAEMQKFEKDLKREDLLEKKK